MLADHRTSGAVVKRSNVNNGGHDGPVTLLGIETSCDETSAAVVYRSADGHGEILSNVVLSQTAEHAPYGGVVPEIAARSHLVHLDRLVKEAMTEARVGFDGLDAIAVTAGPGLIGGVLTGLMTAKAIAMAAGKPLYAVNHLEGHALTPGLTEGLRPPYLMLLVSGGHTQLVSVEGVGRYVRLGTTIDDALGEAFDKTAKLLGLGYPGGPEVEKAASTGNPARYDFPVPMKGREGCNFSFSGLKTAVRQAAVNAGSLSMQDVRTFVLRSSRRPVLRWRIVSDMPWTSLRYRTVVWRKRCWWRPAAWRQTRHSGPRWTLSASAWFQVEHAPCRTVHRQCSNDCVGGC
jgi:tRNA threonylcarbamoyl adenosine modification protein TsaD